jgi:hypothetical protein
VEGFGHIDRIRVHAQEDDLCPRNGSPQLPGGVDAVQKWHRYIQQDDIRSEFGRGCEQRPSILHCANNVEMRLEQLLQTLKYHDMIVGQ